MTEEFRPISNLRAGALAYSESVPTVPENIQRAMRKRGIIPAELAARMAVLPQRVNDWLHRSNSVQVLTLLRIAAALEATIGELVEGVDEKYDASLTRGVTPPSDNDSGSLNASELLAQNRVLEQQRDEAVLRG